MKITKPIKNDKTFWTFFPSGAGGNPSISSKNMNGLQKMRAVLLIILRVERARLDKILGGRNQFEGFAEL